jgi:hypothetical protein
MRLNRSICVVCMLLAMTACGRSPVSVAGDQYLTHDEFGFSIGLPTDLAENGWHITADTDASVHDTYYSFSFTPGDGNWPPLLAHATSKRGRASLTATELVEQYFAPLEGMEEWTTRAQSFQVLDRWPDVVEATAIKVAPDGSVAMGHYVRYVVSGGLTLSTKAHKWVYPTENETVEDLVSRLSTEWEPALPLYRRISDTLAFQ